MKPFCFTKWSMDNPKCRHCTFNTECKRETLKGVGKLVRDSKTRRDL